tara:strand:- start:63 stop:347 length:285 start_codon:yes stop_codon:yes gene_type:complete
MVSNNNQEIGTFRFGQNAREEIKSWQNYQTFSLPYFLQDLSFVFVGIKVGGRFWKPHQKVNSEFPALAGYRFIFRNPEIPFTMWKRSRVAKAMI